MIDEEKEAEEKVDETELDAVIDEKKVFSLQLITSKNCKSKYCLRRPRVSSLRCKRRSDLTCKDFY